MDNNTNKQLTKKERYELKKQQKTGQEKQVAKKRALFSFAKKSALILGVLAVLALLIWMGVNSSPSTDEAGGEIVSSQSIHWHPELSIIIKGEEQVLPANIGIGTQYKDHPQYDSSMRMTNIHTHDASGTLHWEAMRGPVRKDDVLLGQFFGIWEKRFDSECILDFCSGEEGTVKMYVNGEENTEFQNYPVKDGDKIEIRYE